MAATRPIIFISLLIISATANQPRWSRQISSYTSDISDWVPLPGPVERQDAPSPPARRPHENAPAKRQIAEPRILAEPMNFPVFPGFGQDAFPGPVPNRPFYPQQSNRQLYLQSMPSVPSAPQNFLSEQGFGQGIRFGLSQPNFPLSQGFVAPQLSFDTFQQPRPRQPQNPVKFESFPKSLPSLPMSLNAKPFSNHQQNQPPHQAKKPVAPKFMDGYQLENTSNSFAFPSNKKKPQSLQKLKYEPKLPEAVPTQSKPKSEREEVQLLYVPVESLNRGQFNFRNPGQMQFLNGELQNQGLQMPPAPQQQFSSEFQRPLDGFSFGQEYYPGFDAQKALDQIPKFSTSSPFPTAAPTTPKPKKLKPHQPPLAVFLAQENSKKNDKIKVGDVLSSLKNVKTIAVLDTVNPSNAPKVFIGPSSLSPPEHFVKFELPYLSNIENPDRKLKQLPFFVAPLSYNTPEGFAKIPFPSPHVGSVIVNSLVKDTTTVLPSSPAAHVIPNSYTVTPAYKEQKAPAKPTFSYYSTAAPKTNPPPNKAFQSNYYSIEPQQVTSIRPQQEDLSKSPPKPGNYYQNDNKYSQYNQYQNGPVRGFSKTETSTPTQQYTTKPDVVSFGPQDTSSFSEETVDYSKSKVPTTTRLSTTKQTTTKLSTQSPSTYPSHLIQTHNPYSINQAFHLSTPSDYQSYFEEGYATSPGPKQPSSSNKPEVPSTETSKYQTSPNYESNYSPEIHYELEQNSRYPYNTNKEYTSNPELSSEVSQVNTQYNSNVETKSPVQYETQTPESASQTYNSQDASDVEATRAPNGYNQYVNNDVDSKETEERTSTTGTTTTTTRRTNLRTRGRPRYTSTTPRTSTESDEPTKTYTRKPLRERRPLPTRSRYEPNKITTERATRKPTETESSTKSTRGRVRGRVQFKPTGDDEAIEKRKGEKKEADLAYQRDVLHQNYPVTIQERMSTADIEAITEPVRHSSANLEPVTETYDTEQAYSNENSYSQQGQEDTEVPFARKQSYSQQTSQETESSYSRQPQLTKQVYSQQTTVQETEPPQRQQVTKQSYQQTEAPETSYSRQPQVTRQYQQAQDIEVPYSRQPQGSIQKAQDIELSYSRQPQVSLQTEAPYVPRVPTTRNDEYVYHSRSTAVPEIVAPYSESSVPETFSSRTPSRTPEILSIATEPISPVTESASQYTGNNEYPSAEEKITPKVEVETTKVTEPEIEITTPSRTYVGSSLAGRLRRPAVRHYNQVSSTESPNTITSKTTKTDRRRPVVHAVTYRPAFDRRRTTMRIEEIEADLKTKQILSRPEQEHRHPVYKPEPTTEPAVTSLKETTSKRGQFRRRRPTYTTTSTEASVTKKQSYEIKSRYKGRRPTTEKAKTEAQTDASTSTSRTVPYSRYTRPKLSERFNKKPVETNEEHEDQDSNSSINRPRYVAPEEPEWSPKFSENSFKPYNPNDIQDEKKLATTERKTTDDELDIITAGNDYEEILVAVTPASNRANKKIPEMAPTLEALVEQSKTNTEAGESTFESMLEEVMKSLEEQDENEYTTNVMKHKGGEIGEIPPEKVIGADDGRLVTAAANDVTTVVPDSGDAEHVEEEQERKTRRRGFWKKVNVRPLTTESIEAAESQYYSSSLNRLSESDKPFRLHEKNTEKAKVTTYKPIQPPQQFMDDLLRDEDEEAVTVLDDIVKVDAKNTVISSSSSVQDETITEAVTVPDNREIVTDLNPGEMDLGTGTPDPTVIDSFYATTETATKVDRSDGYSFMDYLFGVTSSEGNKIDDFDDKEATTVSEEVKEVTKPKLATTESTFIPDEITAVSREDETTEGTLEFAEIQKLNNTVAKTEEKLEDSVAENTKDEIKEDVKEIETSSVSSFMDPMNVMSTSMSTEISHETEICFRGKCIKTSKDVL